MKPLLTILPILFCGLSILAQVPQSFQYQGIYRDEGGLPISNQAVTVEVSIFDDPQGINTPLYCEQHLVTTNEFGLFNIQVGTGTLCFVNGPAFGDINWIGPSLYLGVQIGLDAFPISPIVAVPYAFYGRDEDFDPANELQTVSIQDNEVTLSQNGSTAEIPPRWRAGTLIPGSLNTITIDHGLGKQPRKVRLSAGDATTWGNCHSEWYDYDQNGTGFCTIHYSLGGGTDPIFGTSDFRYSNSNTVMKFYGKNPQDELIGYEYDMVIDENTMTLTLDITDGELFSTFLRINWYVEY